MRIRELLEGKRFNDLDFVQKSEDGEEINFDICEDLVYFMNHDDDVYRRHVYPSISKCIDRVKSNREINPSIFKNAVEEGYKNYIKKFPVRHLPNNLDEQLFGEVCKKMHEDFCKHYDDGKYKD